ncbi:hypothetical protein H2201_003405 [Coniosporium apollinis]|uniref:Uncharacterized protein n=2 Tax=Coniosporium TaxID=2810619 RepID=A0ABQ9NXL3_9PEZI|nr:hypothetical protein H2199_002156 [Cladosporium sp. JES 115]KAJ9666483.1 hypothetical protein H2201_003405 [Coniosporium apollinis]
MTDAANTDLAFSYKSIAYAHGIQNRPQYQVVKVHGCSSISLATIEIEETPPLIATGQEPTDRKEDKNAGAIAGLLSIGSLDDREDELTIQNLRGLRIAIVYLRKSEQASIVGNHKYARVDQEAYRKTKKGTQAEYDLRDEFVN